MGPDGLGELRSVASFPRASRTEEYDRSLICKFGIGELAADILVEEPVPKREWGPAA